jgi:hypothetical protein
MNSIFIFIAGLILSGVGVYLLVEINEIRNRLVQDVFDDIREAEALQESQKSRTQATA